MRHHINCEDVEAFLAVACELSFHRAATALNVSQPTVSRRVASLERAAGVRLVKRGGVEVSLTREGDLFLPAARDLWNAHRRAGSAAKQLRAVAAHPTAG